MAHAKMTRSMKRSVRTTVDIPEPLYRKLKTHAAARGRSVRELVLSGIKAVLNEPADAVRDPEFPIIKSNGPKIDVTYDQIHEQFP